MFLIPGGHYTYIYIVVQSIKGKRGFDNSKRKLLQHHRISIKYKFHKKMKKN